MIHGLLNKFYPDQVYVAFDGGKAEWRKKILPEYKDREHRIDLDYESFARQKADVATLLAHLGVRVIWEKNQEADDLIALLAYRLKGYLTIVSSDKDFHQLITHNVSVWRPANNSLLNLITCRTLMGYAPEECVDYLCLMGDKSDKIPGVRGLGEKRIRAFLDKYKTIEGFLDTEDKSFGSISSGDIEEAYVRNRRLISLSYAYRKYWRNVQVNLEPAHEFDRAKALSVLRKYEVNLLSKPGFVTHFQKLK